MVSPGYMGKRDTGHCAASFGSRRERERNVGTESSRAKRPRLTRTGSRSAAPFVL